MPSLQSHVARLMTNHMLVRQFSHSRSIHKWRDMMERFSRFQRMPAGTQTQPILINGLAAEWVHAAGARMDRAILYLHGGAFVMGSPTTHRELAARLSATTEGRILALDYR